MVDFPEEIIKAVFKLREKYRNKRNCVVMAFPVVEIIRYLVDKEISVKLFYNYSNNTFEMQAPDYRFYSRISHYDFRKTERRWMRNRDFLFSLLRDLKQCGLWNYVSNKDMIIVNSFNKSTDPTKLLAVLRTVVD